jgi:D-glycerate 3-kinase
MDAFIQLKPQDHRFVLKWRAEAEKRMKASGKPGMTDAEIQAYIETFLPAYELYLPGLSGSPISGQSLVYEIGSDRIPSPVQSNTG